MRKLTDKVAIITGSSIGIGRKMAEQMLEAGAKVVLNGRNEKRLMDAFKEFKKQDLPVIAVAGDVSKYEDCQRLIDESIKAFGQIDFLINNAGISMEGTVEELNPDIFKKVMEVNYLGSVYPTKCALPHLKKADGSIIFVSSVAGIRGIPNHAVYSSSKMSLTALAEALRIELQETKVHVGVAYVGFTENDPQKTIYDSQGKIIPQPKRDFIKAEPVEKVAARIIRMAEKRTLKNVFTPLGKLNAIINRFLPFIVTKVLSNNYRKTK